MNKVFKNSAIFLSIVLIFLYSCQKDKFLLSQDAYIDIQADTIRFDTVFTSLGSFTQSFKIINNNKQKILLSTIKLMGGTNSAYHLNINTQRKNRHVGARLEGNITIDRLKIFENDYVKKYGIKKLENLRSI